MKKFKRFEAASKLSKEEKNKVLASMEDAYVKNGAETGIIGFNHDGDPIEGFLPNQREFMETSDITGAKIRWIIYLPDGQQAHPSEVYPSISASEIQAEERRRIRKEIEERRIKNRVEKFKWFAQMVSYLEECKEMFESGEAIIYKRPANINGEEGCFENRFRIKGVRDFAFSSWFRNHFLHDFGYDATSEAFNEYVGIDNIDCSFLFEAAGVEIKIMTFEEAGGEMEIKPLF